MEVGYWCIAVCVTCIVLCSDAGARVCALCLCVILFMKIKITHGSRLLPALCCFVQ